jgi:prepilin-type N-terminal cleavage/methylation domain-containing protein
MFSSRIKDPRGFTLVELIAIMLILGIMATVAVVKYHGSGMAKDAAYRKVIPMLNADERLIWSSIKLDGTYSDTSDNDILHDVADRPGVTFDPSDSNPISVEYNGIVLLLNRTISNRSSPGHWQ